jgi:hypothetical protein
MGNMESEKVREKIPVSCALIKGRVPPSPPPSGYFVVICGHATYSFGIPENPFQDYGGAL